MPQVEVTFDIDANGIVNVSAKDKATNKEQQIRIQASGGLSDKEIEKMVKEAEANASEDKKRKELVEAKNHAESLVHSTGKSLAEYGDKVSTADKSAIEAAIADVKSVMESEDAEAIKTKTNALAQAAMKLGEALYKSSQAGGEAGGAPGGNGAGPSADANDDVVDADFEEVKDDDKKAP
jgi:molecular chaperone DnaK